MASHAVLRTLPGHASDGPMSAHPTPDQPVLVHDFSLDAVDLRCRLPLDVCTHYHLHSESHGAFLRGSRVRVLACRRGHDGLYAIAAEICR